MNRNRIGTKQLVRRVHYLPDENALVREVDRLVREAGYRTPRGETVEKWGRHRIFSVFIRPSMSGSACNKMAFGICMRILPEWRRGPHFGSISSLEFSIAFTAHANDIFSPRDFVVSLAKLLAKRGGDRDGERLRSGISSKTVFPKPLRKWDRIYNGGICLAFIRLILAVGSQHRLHRQID